MLRNFAVVTLLALTPGPAPVLAPFSTLVSDEGEQGQARTTLSIQGMTCGGCAAAVRSALKKADGVTSYEVSLEKKEAQIFFDPRKTDPEKIAAAVSKTGFKASVKSGGKGGPKK